MGVVTHLHDDFIEVVQCTASHEQQRQTGVGRGDAFVGAVEQFRVEQFFQLAEPFADRRRGDVFAFGGGSNGAFFNDTDKESQRDRIEFHGKYRFGLNGQHRTSLGIGSKRPGQQMAGVGYLCLEAKGFQHLVNGGDRCRQHRFFEAILDKLDRG
jgi:hypothetical protein